MFQKRIKSEDNLNLFLFNLFTQCSELPKEKWNLIDKVPRTFFHENILLLDNINFSYFHFQLTHINFKNCHFKNCNFSNQILIDCDFNNTSFEQLNFYSCIINQSTAATFPKDLLNQFITQDDYAFTNNRIQDDIPFKRLRKTCQDWLEGHNRSSTYENLSKLLGRKTLNKQLIEFLKNQIKPFDSCYDFIIRPSSEGFYHFDDEINQKKYFWGWKLHLSVDKNLIKEAYNCVAPLLLDNQDILSFKVIDVSEVEGGRLMEGAQITMYLYQDGLNPLASEEKLKNLLQIMTIKLQEANINPGKIPDSDCNTHYPYFSLRNDGSRLEYYPASEVGRNYNPFNLLPIFNFLTPNKQKSFNMLEHFELFNKNADNLLEKAFTATLYAFIYECLEPEQVYSLSLENIRNISSIDPNIIYFSLQSLVKYIKKDISDADLALFYFLIFFIDDMRRSYTGEDSTTKFIKLIKNFNAIVPLSDKDDEWKFYNLVDLFQKGTGANSGFQQLHALISTITEQTSPNSSLSSIREEMLFNEIRIPQITIDKFSKSSNLYRFYQQPSSNDEEYYKIYYNEYFPFISQELKTAIEPHIAKLDKLIKKGNIRIEQLKNLNEQKQYLFIVHAKIICELIESGITFETLITMPMALLSALSNNRKEISNLCTNFNVTLLKFLEYDFRKVTLIFNCSKKVPDLLFFFNMSLEQLLALPVEKVDLLLDYYIPDEQKRSVLINYAHLVTFDAVIVQILLKNMNLTKDHGLNENLLVELSQKSLDIQQFCFQGIYHLANWIQKFQFNFDQFYQARNLLSEHAYDLMDSLPIILNNFKINGNPISLEALLELPKKLQIVLCKNSGEVLKLLSFFSINLDEILALNKTMAYDILESAGKIFTISKKLNLVFQDMLRAEETIKNKNGLKLSDVVYHDKFIISVVKKGVPFEQIFKLDTHDLYDVSYNYEKATLKEKATKLIERHFPEIDVDDNNDDDKNTARLTM